jgi:hypothetical protein
VLLVSCRKNEFTDSPDALVTTTVDSLHFDTVFTTTGSFTQAFKIVNKNEQGVRLSSVRLLGGNASPFRINVDGTPGPQVNEIEIRDNDSVYVFVTVSIDPTSSTLPFVVQDSIEINYNGNRQLVQLDAYGQNAHFYRAREIKADAVWNNDLPYVILGGLAVDTGVTLTINKGCRIYMHADAPFIVDGTLRVNGEKWDSTRVVFTGDRLDDPYRDFPASHPGIIFTGSSVNNVLTYATIKNAYQGIVADRPASNGAPKVTLNEVIVDNAYETGVLGFHSSITARNLLVSNCGRNIYLVNGGTYSFTHATVVSVSNSYVQHKEPVLVATDFINQTDAPRPLDATFRNCIFWGEGGLVDNEVVVATRNPAASRVVFEGVLWKVKTPPPATVVGTPLTAAPVFDSINHSRRIFNYRLKAGSPGIDAGVNAGVTLDLDGAPRPVGLPDLGAWERQ